MPKATSNLNLIAGIENSLEEEIVIVNRNNRTLRHAWLADNYLSGDGLVRAREEDKAEIAESSRMQIHRRRGVFCVPTLPAILEVPRCLAFLSFPAFTTLHPCIVLRYAP